MKISIRILTFSLTILLCIPLYSCKNNTDVQNESSVSDIQTTSDTTIIKFPPEYCDLTMLNIAIDRSKSYSVSSDLIFEVKCGTKKSNTILTPSYAVLEVRNGIREYCVYSTEEIEEYPFLKDEANYEENTSLIYTYRFDNYYEYMNWDYVANENHEWELVTPLTVNISLRGEELIDPTGSIMFFLLVYDDNGTNIGIYNMSRGISYKKEGDKFFFS